MMPFNYILRKCTGRGYKFTKLQEKVNHLIYIYIYIYIIYIQRERDNRLIAQVGRVFANGPGDMGSIPGRVIPKKFKKWYLVPPWLTLSNIRYVSRVKWSNPRKGIVTSPTPRCCSYWKGSFLVAVDYSRQFYFIYIDNIKIFAENRKELETLRQTIRIYNQDIRMKFSIETCTMLIIKSAKIETMKRIKLPNQENNKYSEMMDADTIKQTEMKEKITK